jgi:nucleoid-associated protein YgaU
MAVFRSSRYYTGDAQQIKNKTTGLFNWTVYRDFPGATQISYIDYTWVDGDRIDYLADVFLGNGTLWWKIMDINPTIQDPFSIKEGTVIRIPRS